MATVKSLQIEADIDRKYGDHLAQFFAAFISDDKFRLVCDGKTLGSLPVIRPLVSEPDRQPTTQTRLSSFSEAVRRSATKFSCFASTNQPFVKSGSRP